MTIRSADGKSLGPCGVKTFNEILGPSDETIGEALGEILDAAQEET